MFRQKWFTLFFNGTINNAKDIKEELIVKFIGSFNIQDCKICYNRKSNTEEGNELDDILMAWRIRVMNLALIEKLPTWNKEVLSDGFFFELAKLSYMEEGPKLAKEFLNKAGIHFIIEKHLEKTHLDGSSMLMPDKSPLIALTLRYDRLDSFWFTLFHELAHVKLHLQENQTIFFDDMTKEMKDKEKEADLFAKHMLISNEVWKKSGLSIESSSIDITKFSLINRINPAIPAGRLRYESGNYKVFSNLIGTGMVRKMFGYNI